VGRFKLFQDIPRAIRREIVDDDNLLFECSFLDALQDL
jgi:hypothetical protein